MRLKAPDLTSTDRARADAPPALVVGWDEASAGRLPGDDAVAVEAGLAPDASWRSALRAAGVRVAPGETSVVTLPSGDGSLRRAVLVGIDGSGQDRGGAALGELAQRAARALPDQRRWVTSLPALGAEGASAAGGAAAAESVAEGLVLGGYAYTGGAETEVTVVGEPEAWTSAARLGLERGRLVNRTRRLVDRPGGELDPVAFADECVALLEESGAHCEVWEGEMLLQHGFGATAAVGRGAEQGPRVVVARRRGSTRRHLGLAGKGVTFDAGGLNLKTDAQEINWMKSDMAGAVSVAGAVLAAVRAGADPDVTVVIPIAENAVGPRSFHPGDVVQHPDGTRTEILNTDCEGRLLLADALAWMSTPPSGANGHPGVAGLIDVGTLGDACGFGPRLWSVAGRGLVDELVRAGDLVGDAGWPAPVLGDYESVIATSTVADHVNWAPTSGIGGTVLAGVYLSRFTRGLPWAHIDNGSTAYLEREYGPWPVGATGSPLRALARFLRDQL